MPRSIKRKWLTFPAPIITPSSSKADAGHDEDISKKKSLQRGVWNKKTINRLKCIHNQLFEREKELSKKWPYPVDTTIWIWEIGDTLYLMDEFIHSDLQIFFMADGLEEASGKRKTQVSCARTLYVNGWSQRVHERPDNRCQAMSDEWSRPSPPLYRIVLKSNWRRILRHYPLVQLKPFLWSWKSFSTLKRKACLPAGAGLKPAWH